MIVINLQCQSGHRFDGWFASLDKFAEQRAAQQLGCPVCGTMQVEKLLSAPAIGRASTPDVSAKSPADMGAVLRAFRQMARSAEDVGERFPDEARAMHYGEIASRDIRGQASANELRALIDEGVSVLPLPAIAAEEGH